ncbi:MAG: IS66 family transposase, partial [Terriglobales bacterium]
LEVLTCAVSFAERDAQLKAHLAQMREEYEHGLADPGLHRAARKALTSLKNHWEGLTVFGEHPRVRMDNNTVETALRNEVLGRKGYYGSGSVWAAELAALQFSVLMTLVHSWQINPRRWLQEYLEACAENGQKPPQDLSRFLPWQMSPERLRELRAAAAPVPATNTS